MKIRFVNLFEFNLIEKPIKPKNKSPFKDGEKYWYFKIPFNGELKWNSPKDKLPDKIQNYIERDFFMVEELEYSMRYISQNWKHPINDVHNPEHQKYRKVSNFYKQKAEEMKKNWDIYEQKIFEYLKTEKPHLGINHIAWIYHFKNEWPVEYQNLHNNLEEEYKKILHMIKTNDVDMWAERPWIGIPQQIDFNNLHNRKMIMKIVDSKF